MTNMETKTQYGLLTCPYCNGQVMTPFQMALASSPWRGIRPDCRSCGRKLFLNVGTYSLLVLAILLAMKIFDYSFSIIWAPTSGIINGEMQFDSLGSVIFQKHAPTLSGDFQKHAPT